MKTINGVTYQQLADEVGEVYLKQMIELCPEIQHQEVYDEQDASLVIIRAISAKMKATGSTSVKNTVKKMREEQQQGQGQSPNGNEKQETKTSKGKISRQQSSTSHSLQAAFCQTTLNYYQAQAAVGIGQGVVAADVTREKRQEAFAGRYTQGLHEDTLALSGQLQQITNQAASVAGQTISVQDYIGEVPLVSDAPSFDASSFTGASAGLGFSSDEFFLKAEGKGLLPPE